jgi:energy-coupling factor transport system permease protein
MFVPGKNHIIKPIIPGIGFTKEGLFFGLMTGCRIIALMLLLPMLTAMTGNHQIALALNRLGLNYRVSFIISTAFLFIPVFKDTAKDIIDAQKLRGCVSFERAFFVTRLKAYSTLAIPLVLGAMKKAQAAGDAMDSRAFGVFKTRTWVDNLTMKKHDFIFMAASAVLGVVFLFFNYR